MLNLLVLSLALCLATSVQSTLIKIAATRVPDSQTRSQGLAKRDIAVNELLEDKALLTCKFEA